MVKNILVLSGFVVDTFSEIEDSFIQLSENSNKDLRFIWLVPDINNKYNRYENKKNRNILTEPLFVMKLKERGIPYIVGNISKFNILSNYSLLKGIIEKENIHAVYTHFGFEKFHAAFISKLLGRKVVWHEHCNSLGTKSALFKNTFSRLFIDYFISISDFITSTLPKGIETVTIKNSINVDAPKPSEVSNMNMLRRLLSIPEEKKVILMADAFRPGKQHDIAFEICQKVLGVRKDVIFIFLGDGKNRKDFMSKVTRSNLKTYIKAPGHILNVRDYYKAADISFITSTNEPFSYSVLGAFKNSLPLVAFDTSGINEIIKDGYSGILVPEGNIEVFSAEILELLDNEEKREKIGINAFEEVSAEFDRKNWIQNHLNFFERI